MSGRSLEIIPTHPINDDLRKRYSNSITGLDRPIGFQEDEAPRFQDSRHVKVVRLSALRTSHITPRKFLVIISVRGWVDPRAIVRPVRLCQWKIPMTPSKIEPATCRLGAQCLNQMRHCIPLTIYVLWQHNEKQCEYSNCILFITPFPSSLLLNALITEQPMLPLGEHIYAH